MLCGANIPHSYKRLQNYKIILYCSINIQCLFTSNVILMFFRMCASRKTNIRHVLSAVREPSENTRQYIRDMGIASSHVPKGKTKTAAAEKSAAAVLYNIILRIPANYFETNLRMVLASLSLGSRARVFSQYCFERSLLSFFM